MSEWNNSTQPTQPLNQRATKVAHVLVSKASNHQMIFLIIVITTTSIIGIFIVIVLFARLRLPCCGAVSSAFSNGESLGSGGLTRG